MGTYAPPAAKIPMTATICSHPLSMTTATNWLGVTPRERSLCPT